MRSDGDYQDEIREHIAMETQANIDRGMSPEDAERAARITFGSVSGTRQRLYEGRRSYWWSTAAQDIRYAFRAIRRNLQLSCAVVLTLSIGIGLTTSVFSLINVLAFHPPVSRDPESFVMVLDDRPWPSNQNSVPGYERIRAQVQSVGELAAWSGSGSFRLKAPLGATDTSQVEGWLTSCNFFSVFNDEPPRLGRFLQEDDCSKRLPVVVLSDRIWRVRFSADADIVGQSVSYGGVALTVIGVALPPKLVEAGVPSLWIPYTAQPLLKDASLFPKSDWLQDESFHWLQMAGRLRPGYSREMAAEELRILMGREKPRDPRVKTAIRLTDGSRWTNFPYDALVFLAAALSFPTLIMAIVCATVSTLLLSRAVSRQREMAVRLALGGGRGRLIQMLLAETFVLSFAASVLSLVFVLKVPKALMNFVFPGAPNIAITPDWRVFLYLAVLTIMTTVLSGLTPALLSLKTELSQSLKGREILGRTGNSWIRHALVGIQIALCLVLLVSAGVLLRAERRRSDPGFETRQVLTATLPESVALSAAAQTSLAAGIRPASGIRAIGFSASLPGLFEWELSLHFPGRPSESISSAEVSAEYFATLGIPIVSGRTFTDADASSLGGDEAVVISQSLADRVFPQQSPLGQLLGTNRDTVNERRFRVIGVARDRLAVGRNDGSFVYQRMRAQPNAYILVRFEGDPLPAARTLQTLLREQTGAVLPVSTMESRLAERVAPIRRVEILVIAMGAIGLGLALIGVYGVVSFAVTQRKGDFAIRAALGASRATIFRTVMFAGLRPIPIAMVAGIGLSFSTLKILTTQGVLSILGLASNDPIPLIAAPALLFLVILGALTLPARRAMVSDPLKALRDE